MLDERCEGRIEGVKEKVAYRDAPHLKKMCNLKQLIFFLLYKIIYHARSPIILARSAVITQIIGIEKWNRTLVL